MTIYYQRKIYCPFIFNIYLLLSFLWLLKFKNSIFIFLFENKTIIHILGKNNYYKFSNWQKWDISINKVKKLHLNLEFFSQNVTNKY